MVEGRGTASSISTGKGRWVRLSPANPAYAPPADRGRTGGLCKGSLVAVLAPQV